MPCDKCGQPMWNYHGEWQCLNPYCGSQVPRTERGKQFIVRKVDPEGSNTV